MNEGVSLARLESTDQELAVAQADATYENVGRLVNRARAMTKAGGTTVADSEQVEFQYRQADIARRKAHRDLDLTKIVAPFSGVVTARYARPGRFVSAGDTLFRVTEDDSIACARARSRRQRDQRARRRSGGRGRCFGRDGESDGASRRTRVRCGERDTRDRAASRGRAGIFCPART